MTAATRLLPQIPLAGCLLTGDALYCQHELCTQVLAAGGTAAGLFGPEWIEAVAAHCVTLSLVTELAVETLRATGTGDHAKFDFGLTKTGVFGGHYKQQKTRRQPFTLPR